MKILMILLSLGNLHLCFAASNVNNNFEILNAHNTQEDIIDIFDTSNMDASIHDSYFNSVNWNGQTIESLYKLPSISEEKENELNSKDEFVCEIVDAVENLNTETDNDRKFMLEYLKDLENEIEISEDKHIEMTQKLIKYRMLGGQYYVSAAKYSMMTEAKRKINSFASDYIEKNTAPQQCEIMTINEKRKKFPLNSEECRKEIEVKVQKIPAGLVAVQGSVESNWGTSEQALNENNFLGLQIRFGNPSSMPDFKQCRPAHKAKNICVLKFESLEGSIMEYFYRFNGSPVYGYVNYRKERLIQLTDNHELKTSKRGDDDQCQMSHHMAQFLSFYAKDPTYTSKVQHKIKELDHQDNTSICERIQKCSSKEI